ncbi:hypothetical protein TBS_10700 [Thermobispora bispora]
MRSQTGAHPGPGAVDTQMDARRRTRHRALARVHRSADRRTIRRAVGRSAGSRQALTARRSPDGATALATVARRVAGRRYRRTSAPAKGDGGRPPWNRRALGTVPQSWTR